MNKLFAFFIILLSAFGQLVNAQSIANCTPVYTNNAYDTYITNVTIGTINNSHSTTTNSPDYTYFSNQILEAMPNDVFTLSVTSEAFGNSSGVRAFIDFNGNGNFEAGETFNLGEAGATNTVQVTVPSTASNGFVRMRIAANEQNVPSACDNDTYGEAEDYQISICDGTNMAFLSSTGLSTNTGVVKQGMTDQVVLAFDYKTQGCGSAYGINSIDFTIGVSNDNGDIKSAKLMHSTTNDFALATQVGDVVNDPGVNFSISNINNDLSELSQGDQFFWLLYNIDVDATNANVVDAEIVSINTTENGGSQNIPTNSNPTGSREIIYQHCIPVVDPATTGQDFELNSYSIAGFNSRATADGYNSVSATGYNNYSTTDSLVLCAGSKYAFAANTTNGDVANMAFVQFWADWNQDGDFDDVDEHQVLGATGLATGAIVILTITDDFNTEIYVPEHAKNGYTVARVGLSADAKNISCGNFAKGEFDDILIRVNSFESASQGYAFNQDGSTVGLTRTSALTGFIWQESTDLATFTDVLGSDDAASLDVVPTKTVRAYKINKQIAECPADVDGNSFVQSGITEVLLAGFDSVVADPIEVCVGDSSYLKSYYGFKSSVIEDAPAANILGQGAAYSGTITVPNTELVSKFNLSKVCIDVTTSLIEDLAFELEAPSGKKAMLTKGSSVNAAAQNYNFCLMLDTTLAKIENETAALDGDYQPVVSWTELSGDATNGDWKLNVLSSNGAVDATLNSWSLKFGHNDSVNWTDPATFFNANLDSSKAQINATQFFTANLKSDLVPNGFIMDSVNVVANDPNNLDVDRFESNDGDFLLCAGNDKHVKVFLTNPIAGDNYTWYVNDVVVPGENRDSIIINTLNDGDELKVEFSLVNGCGTLFATDSLDLFNRPMPTPIIDLSSTLPAALCDPTDFTVNAAFTDTLAQAVYSWRINSTEVAQKVNTYDFIGLNNGDSVFVTVSQLICGTDYMDTDTIVYEFTPRVDILGDLIGDVSEYCKGDVSLTFDTTGNDASGQFYWVLGTDTISTEDAVNLDTLAAGSFTLSVEYTPVGCYNTANLKEILSFEVLDILSPVIEISTPIDTLCPMEGVTIKASRIENAGDAPIYTWYQNGNKLNFENNDSLVIVNQNLVKTYYVEMESSYLCPDQSKVSSNTLKIDVQKDAIVKLNAERISPIVGCKDGEVKLKGTFSDDPADYYYWTANDSIIPNSNTLNPTFARDSGSFAYRLYGVRNFVCRGIDTIASAEIHTFENYEAPDSTFVLNKVDDEYVANINESSENATATWFLNGNFISGNNQTIVTFTQEINTLCVDVAIANTCITSSCQEFSFVGIDEHLSHSLSVYPNPSQSILNINWLGKDDQSNVEYTIVNQLGKTIQAGTLKNNRIVLDGLAKGSYILQLKSNTAYAVKRFEKI